MHEHAQSLQALAVFKFLEHESESIYIYSKVHPRASQAHRSLRKRIEQVQFHCDRVTPRSASCRDYEVWTSDPSLKPCHWQLMHQQRVWLGAFPHPPFGHGAWSARTFPPVPSRCPDIYKRYYIDMVIYGDIVGATSRPGVDWAPTHIYIYTYIANKNSGLGCRIFLLSS